MAMHALGDVGQIKRLFDGRVVFAAADHADLLVAVEEAVAGGAGARPPVKVCSQVSRPEAPLRSRQAMACS